MMAENQLNATSKWQGTVAWLLLLGSLWLVAACAGGGSYGPAPSTEGIYPPAQAFNYSNTDNYLHGAHSDYSPDLP